MTIKVERAPVDLVAHFWFERQGPMNLAWSPRTFKENFVKNEQKQLWVWEGIRSSDGQERLILNVEPPIIFGLDELKNTGASTIDIRIQFVPVDNKPRQYRLNVGSWDSLNLTEAKVN